MAALAVHTETIGILKFNKVVIINFTVIFPIRVIGGVATNLASAMTVGFDRIGTLDPVDNIGVVNVLFYNVVTT